jgi:hypothetical protein
VLARRFCLNDDHGSPACAGVRRPGGLGQRADGNNGGQLLQRLDNAEEHWQHDLDFAGFLVGKQRRQ